MPRCEMHGSPRIITSARHDGVPLRVLELLRDRNEHGFYRHRRHGVSKRERQKCGRGKAPVEKSKREKEYVEGKVEGGKTGK